MMANQNNSCIIKSYPFVVISNNASLYVISQALSTEAESVTKGKWKSLEISDTNEIRQNTQQGQLVGPHLHLWRLIINSSSTALDRCSSDRSRVSMERCCWQNRVLHNTYGNENRS